MSLIITVFYFLVIIVYLIMGAAIIFHMLHYRINRRASVIMFIIYSIGGVLLLISNLTLFQSVNWNQLFVSFRL